MTLIDKNALRAELLTIESISIDEAQSLYEEFLKGARLDRSGSIDDGDRSQSAQDSNSASRFEEQVHLHESHRKTIEAIDFDAKQEVVPGAVVKVNGRYFAIAVPTPVMQLSGVEVLGISTDAPLFKAMTGLRAGESFEFNGKEVAVEEVQ